MLRANVVMPHQRRFLSRRIQQRCTSFTYLFFWNIWMRSYSLDLS